MTTGITVKDAMVPKVITALQSQTVQEGAEIMRKEDIGSIIICEGKNPIGIVTREDMVTKIVSKNMDASKIKLKDIMSRTLIMATPEEDLAVAARRMVQYGYERLPVIDMGKLIGIISDREIARVAPAAIEILRERLMIDEDDSPEDEHEDVTDGDCELCGSFSEELHSINDKWVCDNCKDEAEGL
ncbi:MAG: CBS domain-containing protein [Nanoarchaeota archaeon]|nr:CBS domain-containing protein [Nanoarchaeota archaeon]MBU4124402.1 CBS domain-containing protein [Nanoarchaeota archaeon]